MKISIKIPHGFEEKFNKLKPEQKGILKAKLSSVVAEELG